MMDKYVFVSGQDVVKYPLDGNDLVEILGDVSKSIQQKIDAGVHKVFSSPKGSDWKKTYVEKNPRWTGDSWVQVWEERDATPEELEERASAKWAIIRRYRNELLADTDWTQFVDVPLSNEKKQEFADYRQELRDITDQPDPFDIWFPEAPNA
jgi:hypothetical protein